MNQFHLYPHQIYRRNTRNNLYTDENKSESPTLDETSKRLKTTNPKEINISDYEDQKQRRIQTEASQNKASDQKQNQYDKLPSLKSQSSKQAKTGGDHNTDQIENQDQLSQRKSRIDKQQKKAAIEDDDGDVFDKKPRSTNLIDNSKGFLDAQQIIDNSQRERLPSINNKLNTNQIDILNRYDDKASPNYRTQSRQQSQSKRNSTSRGSSRSEHRKNQENQLNKSFEQSSPNVQHQKLKNSQINTQDAKNTGLDINISLQDINYDSSASKPDQKNIEQSTANQLDSQKNKKENIVKNNSSLLNKYKLEQEYLKGIKQKSNNNNSVLNESQNIHKSSQEMQQDDGNDSDQSEDTRLNNKINNYRNQYRRNIDEIYKQIKTEHNSPSSRSIYFHEELINNGLRAQGKLKTEPNDDSKNHNLTISRPSIDYNTSLSKVDGDEIDNIQNQSKTVPIHVLLNKIKQRSNYTQKLERLSSNLHGISPNKSQIDLEDSTQSQLAYDHLKAQRQYLTSKKYLNMYSRTIDSMNNYDSNGDKSGKKINENSYLNNSNANNSQNGLVIRNAQKSNGGIYGINKTLDVQRLNEEIDRLEQQSKAYQKLLKISIDCSIDFTKNVTEYKVHSNLE
ncbi:hypothetical protein TTHERM_00145240 (macronuclear) [Tetrahymena thermophila SB210]|uniref:Uncharacterized protein n=1 Tax=Tetrahymena thermophila (strain SB210) TaxID=312017 RepID=I7M7B5_TETTS|nr:hypothetical protein TTHERM_00145240 [Tetrahymena thermophila SB210]EAR90919.2 hypothetical protein TTHERM_00145240 [Tetrahymena thermophila SB210]|eukprot:XP_001011164.2 hypothetical protein TTHERM_00145240 [Tetrahymena thermophila SB210]